MTKPAYAQRSVRIHSAPFGDSAVVRTLLPGELVQVAETDRRSWVKVYEPDGDSIGFAYETNGNLAPKPSAISP